MNDVQELLHQLRGNGWTISALADELGTPRNTVDRWYRGQRQPANASMVKVVLAGLLTKRRIPKKRRSLAEKKI